MRRLHTLMLSTVFGAGLVAAPMAAAIAQTCSCPSGQGQTTGAAEGGGAAAVAFTADQAPPPLPDYDQPRAAVRRLCLDARLLVMEQLRVLLGARHVGRTAAGRIAVDARLLGVRQRRLRLPSRLLGPDHVGFYGGVDYGFGYVGDGYEGGRWDNGRFFVQPRRHQHQHTYASRSTAPSNGSGVNNRQRRTRTVSFNGGPDGTTVKPTREEMQAERAKHVAPTRVQLENARSASHDQDFFFSNNKGKPRVAATEKPGQFTGSAVVPAKGAEGAAPGGANLEKPGQPTPNAGKAGPGSANLAPGEKARRSDAWSRQGGPGAGNASTGQKPESEQNARCRKRRAWNQAGGV